MPIIIQTTNAPSSQFDIALDDDSVRLRFFWSLTGEVWYMDMENLTTGDVVNGIRVVGGVDLFEPYAFHTLGRLFLIDNEGENLDPDFDNFGDRYQLLYVGKNESL